MARIRNGILGGFAGKVGEVIGQNYAGVSTMRAMPKYVTNPRTPAQEAHRAKMAFAGEFFKPFSFVLDFSTWATSSLYNGYNETLRRNFGLITIDVDDIVNILLEDAIFGEYVGEPLPNPVVTIDSIGVGSNVLSVTVSWDGVSLSQWSSPDDIVLMYVVHEDVDGIYHPICGVDTNAVRDDLGAKLDIIVPDSVANGDYLWFAFGVVATNYYRKGHNPQKPKEIINIPAKNRGHNPQKPKEIINIPAKNVVKFSAGSNLKKAVTRGS